jgi:hypothetical protein
MAYSGYGAKYTLTFSDVYQNTTGQYIATIYKKGYSGFVNEVSGTGTPLVIETDRDGGNGGYRPIIATKATLNLLFNYVGEGLGTQEWTPNENIWETYQKIFSESGFDIREFLTAEYDTFLLEVKIKNGASYDIIWQGYYIYNTDVSLNEISPITFSLEFSDFGLTKINRFYNFTAGDTDLIKYFPGDKISLLDVIMRCCYFSYITTRASIEITSFTYNQSYLDGNGGTQIDSLGLDNIFIQKNAFIESLGKYQNLFDVLSGICSQYGLIAFFKNNKFCVRSYEKLVNNTTGTISTKEYLVYYYNDVTDKVEYTFDANVTESDTVTELNSSSFRNINRSQNIRFNYPIESITISNSDSLNHNTPNNNMSSLSQVSGGTTDVRYALNSWYNPDGGECQYDADILINGMNSGVGNCVASPFHPYVNRKTETYGTNFATQFLCGVNTPIFDSSIFIDSEEFSVTTGDVFSLSYSAYTDGRLKNLPLLGDVNQGRMRPRPIVALILLANDENGNETTYFYNHINNKFDSTYFPSLFQESLPLITTPNAVEDSDWIHYDLKGTLDIPQSGKLKIRQYRPYRFYIGSADDRYELYVEYCNLQCFKGSPISSLPKSQKFLSKVTNLKNSDTDFELKSNIFIQNAQTYVPNDLLPSGQPKQKNPIFLATCYGNHVFDRYNYPASGLSLSHLNPACLNISYEQLYNNLRNVTLELLDNISVTNATIEGTFKSDAIYPIGKKFSYQITGYDSKNFSLLDYSIDFKNATYDSLLYSSDFANSEGLTKTTQTIIS